MRAVGYVARRSNQADCNAAGDGSPFSWEHPVLPDAGSWGDASSLRSGQNPSPLDPAERIVEYCDSQGHNLVAIFGVDGGADQLYEDWRRIRESDETADGEKGPNPFLTMFGDPQFADLMEALAGPQGHPALVVVPDASHLADDLETLVERLLIIRRTGSETQCADDELPDPLQSGEELLGLHGGQDWRRKKIRTKVMEKAARGEVLGRTPYGYRCNASGTLEPVPEEAEVVRQVYEWYLGDDGEASEGIGMRLIAQRLTERGVPTRSGKPWSPTTISIIIRNRVYVGTYSRYGFLVVGNHEPIVDRSLFRRVQDALAAKNHQTKRSASDEPFLLGGIARCGECGHGVRGLTRKRSWKRRDASVASKVYRYYEFSECPAKRGDEINQDIETQCSSWRAEELEGEVRRTISSWAQETRRRIEPASVGLSLAERLVAAESTFLQEAAAVSAGRGDLENLEPRLEEIKGLRKAAAELRDAGSNGLRQGGTTDGRYVDRLISDAVESSDARRAHSALASLVDEIIVKDREVNVTPRFKK